MMSAISNSSLTQAISQLFSEQKKKEEESKTAKIADLQNEVNKLRIEKIEQQDETQKNSTEKNNADLLTGIAIIVMFVVAIVGFFLFRRKKR